MTSNGISERRQRRRRATAVGLMVAALLLSGCGAQRSPSDPDEQIATAQAKMKEGDLRTASILLKNALQQQPDRPDARWLLGTLYLQAGAAEPAIKELRKALELGLDVDVGLPALGRALLLRGDFDELLTTADPKRVSEPAAKGEIFALRAAALLARNRRDEAGAEIARAYAVVPAQPLARLVEGRLALLDRRANEAERIAREVLAQDNDNSRAWGLLIDARLARGAWAEAEEAATQAIETTQHGEFLFKRAMIRLRRGDLDGARTDIAALGKRAPRSPSYFYASGIFHFQRGDYAKAQEALEQAAKRRPGHYPTLLYLGATHLFQGRLNQAEAHLAEAVAIAPGSIQSRVLLAAVRLQQGRPEEAERLLRPLEQAGVASPTAMQILAAAALAQGDTERALTLLRTALEEGGKDAARIPLRLGALLLRTGRVEEALPVLEAASATAGARQTASLLLAAALVRSGQTASALERARALRDEGTDDPFPWLLEAQIHLWAGDEQSAERVLRTAWEKIRGERVALALATLLARTASLKEAIAILRTAAKEARDPAPALLLRLAEMEAQAGDLPSARNRIAEMLRRHPDLPIIRVRLAAIELLAGQPAAALEALSSLDERHRDLPAVLELRIRANLAQGAVEKALADAERLVSQRPEYAKGHLLLAEAAWRAGDVDKAVATLEHALATVGKGSRRILTARLVELLIAADRLSEAKKVLAAVENVDDDPIMLLLRGRLLTATGETEAAERAFRAALRLGAGSAALRGIVRTRWRTGGTSETLAFLDDWLARNADDRIAHLLRAEILLVSGRREAARAAYQTIVDRWPKDVVALNNLAQLLQQRDPGRALKLAARAYAQAPRDASVNDTYGWLLYRAGRLAEATPLLARAAAWRPENPSIQYHYAKALAESGDRTRARAALDRALRNGAQAAFPERPEAEALRAELEKDDRS